FNENLTDYIKTNPDPFGFNNLKYIQSSDESKKLNYLKEPCIIISASGMCDAGRVKHHLKNSLPNSKNTILIVGYCSPHTLGNKLMSGNKNVRIFGEYVNVNAEIEVIHGYSAHADYSELLRFLSCQDKKQVKTIFLVHGEDAAKISLKEKLLKEGYPKVIIPVKQDVFELE
ncbi:MAG: MBL fold metallo-hydrolase RNA specificity domain-containing protein, partial [Bacteroidota bacterium]